MQARSQFHHRSPRPGEPLTPSQEGSPPRNSLFLVDLDSLTVDFYGELEALDSRTVISTALTLVHRLGWRPYFPRIPRSRRGTLITGHSSHMPRSEEHTSELQ